MIIWNKKRAQVVPYTCALVLSIAGEFGCILPVRAQAVTPSSAPSTTSTPSATTSTSTPVSSAVPAPGQANSATSPAISTPVTASPAAPPGSPAAVPASPATETTPATVQTPTLGVTTAQPSTPPPAATTIPPLPVTPPAISVPALNPPATTGGETAPQITGRIAQINVRGNQSITTDAIRAVITQKLGEQYDPNVADRDRQSIKDMGYFNGDIGLTAVNDASGGVDITYTVVENPMIKHIVFVANTPDKQPVIAPAKLLSLMDTREGLVLNTNTLVRDLDKLFNRQTGYARQQGYIIDVSSDINIDPLTGTLTIPLIEAHIDAIQIKGNKKTKPVVIMRELHQKPGDILDEKRLQKDLTRIYNLGIFETVGPFDEIPTDVGRVTISIPVVEKRSGTVTVGVGYSSRSKLVGRAELAENNFRGLGERVSFLYEVGSISSASSVELGFFEPYLDKRHTSLDVDVYDKVIYRFSSNQFQSAFGNSSTYTEQRRGGVISVNRPLSDTFSAGLTTRYEDVLTNDVSLPLQGSFIRQDGTVAAIGVRAFNNTRDNDISPAGGGMQSFSYEIGSANTKTVQNAPTPLAPGQHNFGKIGIDLRRYFSLQGPRKLSTSNEPKRVFAARMLLGFSNRDIPFFEQYFLGGADSLRGYQTDRFWGSKLAMVQTELRVPFGKDNTIQGVLLADFGDAWGSIYQAPGLLQHNSFSLSSDYGVGIRLTTPIGPIRLDYAIGRDGGRTQFSIGQSF